MPLTVSCIAPGPRSALEARQLLETRLEGLRFDSETRNRLPPPGPQMTRFMGELEQRWPSLDEDPDGSPWSSSPLWQPEAGGGRDSTSGWSYAASVMSEILEIAARHNVIIYDPQADQVIHPGVQP
jgi:hypothetical protein